MPEDACRKALARSLGVKRTPKAFFGNPQCDRARKFLSELRSD